MSESESTTRTPEEIRAEIEREREELAETAAALAHKTDVKARAHDRVDEIKADAKAKVSDIKDTVKDKTPDSAGGAASSVGSTASAAQVKAKENPVPTAAIAAALAGFALGYLIATRRS